MNKLLMAAVLVLAACGEKQADTQTTDTSAAMPEAAPSTMPADTGMTMPADTGAGAVSPDTSMARDTAPAH